MPGNTAPVAPEVAGVLFFRGPFRSAHNASAVLFAAAAALSRKACRALPGRRQRPTRSRSGSMATHVARPIPGPAQQPSLVLVPGEHGGLRFCHHWGWTRGFLFSIQAGRARGFRFGARSGRARRSPFWRPLQAGRRSPLASIHPGRARRFPLWRPFRAGAKVS
jgi:hypothetical protein